MPPTQIQVEINYFFYKVVFGTMELPIIMMQHILVVGIYLHSILKQLGVLLQIVVLQAVDLNFHNYQQM
jgi:hypothetical protein